MGKKTNESFLRKILGAFILVMGLTCCGRSDAAPRELDAFLSPTRTTKAPIEFTLSPRDAASILYWRTTLGEKFAEALQSGAPVVITLESGDYVMPRYGNFVFKATDSGTPEAPVVFRAEKPGTVRILGMQTLPKSLFSRVASSDVNYARFPSSARANIYVATLPSDIDVFNDVANPDTAAAAAEYLSGVQLYLGGRFQDLARWPNRPNEYTYGWTNVSTIVSVANPSRIVVELPDARAAKWRDLCAITNGVVLHAELAYPWQDEFLRGYSYDSATRRLTLASALSYAPVAGTTACRRFVALNVAEELDAVGEWWLDRKTKRLYYYPEASFLNETEELVLVSNRDKFMQFEEGTHDIHFENLTFAYQERLFGDMGVDSKRIVFDHCAFHSFTRPSEIKGTAYQFRDCAFSHFAGGVLTFFGGSRARLTASGHLVAGCTFRDFQHLKQTTYPAIWPRECGVAVRDCRFEDAAHNAIRLIGNDHFVGWCQFENVLRETLDCGAAYAGRNTSFLGNLFLGCSFKNTKPVAETNLSLSDTRAAAVYLDDGVWGGDIVGCDVDSARCGFFIRGGNFHRVMWNQISDCAVGLSLDRCVAKYDAIMDHFSASDWNSASTDNWFMSYYFGRNASASGSLDWNHPLWRAAYPSLKETIEEVSGRIEPWRNRYEGNIFNACATIVSDATLSGTRTATFQNNVADTLSSAHVGFKALARAVQPTDVSGYVAARARLAALSNAVPVEILSPHGDLRVRVGLDAIGRLACRAEHNGRDVVWPSPMGLTLDEDDWGRFVLLGEPTWQLVENGLTREGSIPLTLAIEGKTGVVLDVRVSDDAFAYRFRAPNASDRTTTGEFFDWQFAPTVAPVASTQAPAVGTFSGAFASAWRTCRLAQTVPTPELYVHEVLADGSVRRPVLTDDPAVMVNYGTGDYKSVGDYTITASLKSGYKWSDGTTAPKTFTYSIRNTLLTEGWSASGNEIRFVKNGAVKWQFEVVVSGLKVTLISRASSRETTLDFTGSEAVWSKLDSACPVGASVVFEEGANQTACAAVTNLNLTSLIPLGTLPAGALRPFTHLVSLTVDNANRDLTIGSGSSSDVCLSAAANVLGTSVPSLRRVAIKGQTIALRNAFGSNDGTLLAEVSVIASGALDLGTHAFNVNSGDRGGSLTNVVLTSGGDMLLGANTLRYSLASGAVIRVTAPPSARVTFNGPSFANQFSSTRTFSLYYLADQPHVTDSAALTGNVFTWYFPAERAQNYLIAQGKDKFINVPIIASDLHVALPDRRSALLHADDPSYAGKWYQQKPNEGVGNGTGGHGIAMWHYFDESSEPLTNRFVETPRLSSRALVAGEAPRVFIGSAESGQAYANYTSDQISRLAPGRYTYCAWTESSSRVGSMTNQSEFIVVESGFVPVAVAIKDWTGKKVADVFAALKSGDDFSFDAAEYFAEKIDYVTAYEGGVVSGTKATGAVSGSRVTWSNLTKPLSTEIFVQPYLPVSSFNRYQNPDPYLVKDPLYENVWYQTYTDSAGLTLRKMSNFPKIEPYEIKRAFSMTNWELSAVYKNDVWAPEIHYLDGAWYAYLSGNSNSSGERRERIFSFRCSGDPMNPQDWGEPTRIRPPDDKWAIDPTILDARAEGRGLYMLWSGWPADANGVQNLYIAEMSSPTSFVNNATRVLLSTPDQAWEKNTSPRVEEGPAILRHGSATYLVFSGSGSWTTGYSLGYLVCTNGDYLTPRSWTKKEGPVFSSRSTALGPGHCSFVKDAAGRDYIAYHAWESTPQSGSEWRGRYLRIQPIAWHNDEPVFGVPRPYGSTEPESLDPEADFSRAHCETRLRVATPVDVTLPWDGAAHTITANTYFFSEDSVTEPGTHTVTCRLRDTTKMVWADGTDGAKTVKITLEKSDDPTPPPTPPTTRLPAGYTELQYVRAEGKAYLDTGYAAQDGLLVELSFAPTALPKDEGKLMLGAYSSGHEAYYAYLDTDKTYACGLGASGDRQKKLFTFSVGTRENLVIAQTNRTLTVSRNGGTLVKKSFSASGTSNTLCLFGRHCDQTIDRLISADLYAARFWLKGELKHDYVPAQNNNSREVGLYDLAAGRFVLPTSGTFVAGPVVETPSTADQPQIGGIAVDSAKVFEFARTTKPIHYPTPPTFKKESGRITAIQYRGVTTPVPIYYTPRLVGTSDVWLDLNENAAPTIKSTLDKPAFQLTPSNITIHIEPNAALPVGAPMAYSVGRSEGLNDSPEKWLRTPPQGTPDFVLERKPFAQEFFRVFVTDDL